MLLLRPRFCKRTSVFTALSLGQVIVWFWLGFLLTALACRTLNSASSLTWDSCWFRLLRRKGVCLNHTNLFLLFLPQSHPVPYHFPQKVQVRSPIHLRRLFVLLQQKVQVRSLIPLRCRV